jgi:hypothetical protein
MEPIEYQRVAITSAEAAHLTQGNWLGIAPGFEIMGYCHECDDMEAIAVVIDYFLDLSCRCVTAEVKYKCCNSESTISFGCLDEGLIVHVLLNKKHKS